MENLLINLEKATFFTTMFRLILALILGGVLGCERGRKRRPAGFRTYIIVCMASALIMLTSEFLIEIYQVGDPMRMGAQVISGVGFLGAGTIIITSGQVKGLTTAAGLWAAACIGLATGAGFYIGAIACSILVLLTMTVLHKMDEYLLRHSRSINLFAEFCTMERLGAFMESLREQDIRLKDIEISKKKDGDLDTVGVCFWVEIPSNYDHLLMIQKLSGIPGVNYLEELELV